MFILLLAAGCVHQQAHPKGRTYVEALLWPHPYSTVVVEIDHAPGREPHPEALETLRVALEEATRKRVEFAPFSEVDLDTPQGGWTDASLFHAHDATYTHGGVNGENGTHVVLHVLYVAGDGPDAHGSSIMNHVTMFPDAFRRTLDPFTNVVTESYVLVHEAGHSLGLVDNGIPMVTPRATPDGAHSTEKDSPMYPYIDYERELQEALLKNGALPMRFNAHDLEDIRAFQAKAPS